MKIHSHFGEVCEGDNRIKCRDIELWAFRIDTEVCDLSLFTIICAGVI